MIVDGRLRHHRLQTLFDVLQRLVEYGRDGRSFLRREAFVLVFGDQKISRRMLQRRRSAHLRISGSATFRTLDTTPGLARYL